MLRAAPHIRLMGCLTATGYNKRPSHSRLAPRELGIVVSNVVAYATDSVAQHVFALMLAHHTRLFDYTAAVRNGEWSRSPQFCLLDFPVRELRGMTLGILGYGELGEAWRASPRPLACRSWCRNALAVLRGMGATRWTRYCANQT